MSQPATDAERGVRHYPEVVGGYSLVRSLGVGATGVVFEAVDAHGTRVALKILHPYLVRDRAAIAHFEREIEVAAAVTSERAVRLLSSGIDDGARFIAMEFVDGRSLADLLRSDGVVPPDRARTIGIEIARAAQELHDGGVVHCDIKPSNVMIASDGRVLLTDYGIARLAVGGAATTTLDFSGSLAYAAPEQAAGHADARSDVYAIGATLLHMLTGSPPERHGLLAALPARLGRTLDQQLDGVEPGLADLIQRCLAMAPGARPPSAAAVADLLARPSAAPAGTRHGALGRVSRIGGRRAVLAAAGTTAMLAALVVAVRLSSGGTNDPPATSAAGISSAPGATCADAAEPVDVRASIRPGEGVMLQWSPPSGCAMGYRVYFTPSEDESAKPSSLPGSRMVDAGVADTAIIRDVDIGTTYAFQVVGYSASGNEGPASPTIRARVYPELSQPARLVSPEPGSTLAGDSVTFRWSPGHNAVWYNFWVSAVGPGRGELFDLPDGPDREALVDHIPADGRTIFATLMTWDGSDTGWFVERYTFRAPDNGLSLATATLTIPATTGGWIDSGIEFAAGDRIVVLAEGQAFDSPERVLPLSPDGRSCAADAANLVSELPCMSLVGQYIGVDPFLVGSNAEFLALQPGRLFLGVNDSFHADNRGEWTVSIRVTR